MNKHLPPPPLKNLILFGNPTNPQGIKDGLDDFVGLALTQQTQASVIKEEEDRRNER
ncbi:hypothetical protein Tco_1024011, partial [Tanacetum coccineum]